MESRYAIGILPVIVFLERVSSRDHQTEVAYFCQRIGRFLPELLLERLDTKP